MEIISLSLLGIKSIFWIVLILTLIIDFVLIIGISSDGNAKLFDYVMGLLIAFPVFISLMIVGLIFWLLLFNFELTMVGVGSGLIFGIILRLVVNLYDPGHSSSGTHIWIRRDTDGKESFAGPASVKAVHDHYNGPWSWEEGVDKIRLFIMYLGHIISVIVLWNIFENIELLQGLIFSYVSLHLLLSNFFKTIIGETDIDGKYEKYKWIILIFTTIIIVIYLMSIVRLISFTIQFI